MVDPALPFIRRNTGFKSALCKGTARTAIAAALCFGPTGASPLLAQTAIQADAIISSGSGQITRGANLDTVTLGSSQAIVDWTPYDANGSGTIDFLPSGNELRFSGASDYIVLNRVAPQDTSRAISFGGNVNSLVAGNTGGTVWFYNPGGIIVGNTASFDVGGLLLTSNPD